MFDDSGNEYEYTTISTESNTLQDLDDKRLFGIFLNFWLDSKGGSIERKAYSFLDMLGDIGGLSDAISLIGSLLASIFSEHLFSIEKVNTIFKTRKGSLIKKKPSL